ncbi:MAG: tetratricopeptide repeat protein [Armatimonadetes bacterium]|nr:tetratricopeptide repeat protein [Armatimonadota bacterium]
MNERDLSTALTRLLDELRGLGRGATSSDKGGAFDDHFESLVRSADGAGAILMSEAARKRGLDALLDRARARAKAKEQEHSYGTFNGEAMGRWGFGLPRASRPIRWSLAFAGLAALILLGYLAVTWQLQRSRAVAPAPPKQTRPLPERLAPDRSAPDRNGPVADNKGGAKSPPPSKRGRGDHKGAVAVKPPTAGTLVRVVGDLQVYEPGAKEARPASRGMKVAFGSRIETGDMGTATLRFSDGTIVGLGFNTIVTLPDAPRGAVSASRPNRISLGLGRLYASVQHDLAGSPFEVVTPVATAQVVGTEFGLEVARTEDESQRLRATLQVREGKVAFFNSFGSETATGMTESVVVEGSKPTEPKRLSVLRLTQGSAYRSVKAPGQSSTTFHLLVDGTSRLTTQSALYRLAMPGGSLLLEGESVADGVRVLYMWSHSPALRAGIWRDDVIVAMDGQPTRSMLDVRRVAWRSMGKRIGVSLIRKGQQRSIPVVPIVEGQPIPSWNADIADAVRPWTDLGLWQSREEGIEGLQRELRENPTCAGWINLGILHEIGDDMGEAIRAFQQAVRLEPQSALAHQNLAIALKKIGNLPRAAEEARIAVRFAPHWPWAHMELSDILLASGDLAGALVATRNGKRLLPGAGLVLHGEAKILQRMGRIPEALQVVHLATEIDPYHVNPWQFLTQYYYQARDGLKDAEIYGRRAIEVNPNDGNSRQVLAGALHRTGRTNEALEQVEEGLRREPQQPYLWQRKGLILSDLGKLEEALVAHEYAVKYDPNNTSFLTNMAYTLEDLGRIREAESAYKKAIEAGPTNRLAYMNLANLYHREGNLGLSETWFRRLYEMAPDFAMGMRGFGHVLAQLGQHVEAVEILKKSLALEPRDPETHWRLGAALTDMGRPEEGEPFLRKSVAMEPRDPFAHVNLARCLVALRKFDEAVKHLAELERLAPQDPQAPYEVAMLMERMNRWEEAEAAYLRSLKINPKFSNALNGLGLLKQRNRLLKEAEDLFRQAIEARSGNIEARSNLADLLAKTGRFEEAVAESRALLKIAPGDAFTLNWLAWEFSERGINLDEALALAKQATKLEPRNANFLDTLGAVFFKRNELPQAILAYKRSIELYGARASAVHVWASLANVYKKQGQHADAAKALAKAAEIEPNNPGRWLDLGNGLAQAGKPKEAEEAFKRALELAPASAQVHLGYGNHLRKVSRYPEAETILRKALALAPKNPFCSINLAEMLKDLKRFDEAVQVYRDFLAIDAANGMVLNNLASIFALTGKNLDEALDLARRAVADNPSRPNRAALVGEIQRMRGDLTDAEIWLRKALDLYKNSTDAAETWAELGLVYEARCNKAKAVEHFRKALSFDPKQQNALDGIKRLGG